MESGANFSPPTRPLLVTGLRHAYQPGLTAVVELDRLALPPGATVALTGPSGSGKTTLAYLLTGIERVQQGVVRWGEVRALLHEPGVVVADEPTASLDATSGAAVIELLLDRVRSSGATLLAVTHDPALVAACGGQLHLDHGRLERLR